jgi:hypothetical protein
MNGKQFIRRARAWARSKGASFRVENTRGKGGRQIAYLG